MSILDLLGGLGRAGASVGGAVGGAIGKAGGAVGRAGGAVGGAIGGNLGTLGSVGASAMDILAPIGQRLPGIKDRLLSDRQKEINRKFGAEYQDAFREGDVGMLDNVISRYSMVVTPDLLKLATNAHRVLQNDEASARSRAWEGQREMMSFMVPSQRTDYLRQQLKDPLSPVSLFVAGDSDPDSPEASAAREAARTMLEKSGQHLGATEEMGLKIMSAEFDAKKARVLTTRAQGKKLRYEMDLSDKLNKAVDAWEEEKKKPEDEQDEERLRVLRDGAVALARRGGDRAMVNYLLDKPADDVIEQENYFRDRIEKKLQPYYLVRDSYFRMMAALKADNAAGDIAVIFNYMKILDPGSVIRESEYAVAKEATSIPNQVLNMYNRAFEGKLLGSERSQMRRQFAKAAFEMMVTHLRTATKMYQQQNDLDDHYHTDVKRYFPVLLDRELLLDYHTYMNGDDATDTLLNERPLLEKMVDLHSGESLENDLVWTSAVLDNMKGGRGHEEYGEPPPKLPTENEEGEGGHQVGTPGNQNQEHTAEANGNTAKGQQYEKNVDDFNKMTEIKKELERMLNKRKVD